MNAEHDRRLASVRSATALTLGLLVQSACFGRPAPECTFVGGTGGLDGDGILLAGQMETVSLMLPSGSTCAKPATDVETEVVGPDNLPLEHTHAAPTSSELAYQVSVSFTPPRAGSYHLRAAFQPNLGVAQADVRAATDRTLASDALTVSADAGVGCTHFAVTAHDTVVCETSSAVRAIRTDAGVHQLSGTTLTVAGDVVWLVNGFEVDRWLDLGSGPLQPLLPSLNALESPRVLLPGADEVWVVGDTHVRHYVAQPVGFMLRENLSYSAGATIPLFAARNAQGVLVSYPSGLCSPTGPDAGTVLVCSGFGSPVVGASEGGIWLGDATAELRVPGHSSPVQTLAAPTGSAWRPVQRQDTLPITPDGYTIGFVGNEAVLEKWDGWPFEAIPGWVVVQYADGRFGFRRD